MALTADIIICSFVLLLVVNGASRPTVCAETLCAEHIEAQSWGDAIRSCGFRAVVDPDDALAAGRAAVQLGRYPQAIWFRALAERTQKRGDVFALSASLAFRRGALNEATGHLVIASAMHAMQGDLEGMAKDQYQFAGVWSQFGDLGLALAAATRALSTSAHACTCTSTTTKVYAHVAFSEVLRNSGNLAGAEKAISDARAEVKKPADQVFVDLKHAVILGDKGSLALAVGPLSRALEIEQLAPRPQILRALWLNSAAADSHAGDHSGALEKLESVLAAGATDEADVSYFLLRSRILAAQGSLSEAREALTRAEQEQPDGEWAISSHRTARSSQRGQVISKPRLQPTAARSRALQSSSRIPASLPRWPRRAFARPIYI